MEAKELMIGDWVRIDEPDKYAGATGQIQSLMYHREGDAAYFHVFIQGKFGYVSRDVCSDDIRPITLTAEILEKNWFKKCAGNEWSVFKYEDDDYTKKALYQVLWSADELYLEIASYTSITGEFYRMGVEFVHQLQHALRLCGIEKEIIL